MSLESRIQELLTEPFEDLGLDIVRIQIHGAQRKRVEIMIERIDRQPVKMDDCVRASKEASTFLYVEDLIKGPYVLDVTSPGIDRPLMQVEDYKRFINSKIKVEVYTARGNRRKFIGDIITANDEEFVLMTEEGQELTFKYTDVKKAKIVPNLDF